MRVTRWILAAALAAASACGGCKDEVEPDRPPIPMQNGSIFSDAFEFVCSPDRQAGCTGVFPVRRPGGDLPPQVAVLRNGEDSLRARVALLEGAKRSIRIQALIFRGDDVGLYFADILKRKAKQGVDVRVIVDALSNLDTPTQWMYFDLKQNGVEVEGYETLYFNWLTADLKVSDPLRPNKRFHDKMWIVDAEDPDGAAIVGGLNIANEYFRVDEVPINRWRDQDVLLKGVVVKDVKRAFDRNYDYFKSLKERLPAIFNPDNSWKLTRGVLDTISKVRTPKWKKANLKAAIQKILRDKPDLQLKTTNARFLQSRPRLKESYIEQAYDHLIRTADERVDIINAYFVPSRGTIDALKDAARRGVKVRVVTNSPATNDIAPIAVISRHLYSDLLEVNLEPEMKANVEAGKALEVWEWIGPEVNEGTLHAKFALFDDKTALVGSYNLDPRSARLNSETAVALDDADIVRRLRTTLDDEDLKLARPIDWDQAQKWRNPEDLSKKFDLLFALPMKGWL
jgi:putative cardiolipin synthase